MWGAIAALVASAALQQINTSVAASRQQRATREAMKRQRDYQMRAEKIAMDNAQEYRTENREKKQDEIADELTQTYFRPVEAAQTEHAAASRTQGDVSQDYLDAKSASDNRQMASAKELATLLGRKNSANRLRQYEAFDMADNASEIARLNNYASRMYNIDNYAIKASGQGNPLLQLGSGVLGAYGGSVLDNELDELEKAKARESPGGVAAK